MNILELTKNERRLLSPPSKVEANRRAYIRAWLEENDIYPEAEYRTKVGPIDLYLTNHRVIIEAKTAGVLGGGGGGCT